VTTNQTTDNAPDPTVDQDAAQTEAVLTEHWACGFRVLKYVGDDVSNPVQVGYDCGALVEIPTNGSLAWAQRRHLALALGQVRSKARADGIAHGRTEVMHKARAFFVGWALEGDASGAASLMRYLEEKFGTRPSDATEGP
jgi:hypothetical protein